MAVEDYDISKELFIVLERVFRLQQMKRKSYINLEMLNSIGDYKKKVKELVSLGLLGYYKKNNCVRITQDGATYILGKEGFQRRERIHTLTKISNNNEIR